ncbi:MAG: hypothetical protein ACTHU0_36575 [Kofleriaceae bacterium]
MSRLALLLVAVAACKGGKRADEQPPAPSDLGSATAPTGAAADQIHGELKIAGQPVAIAACRPGRGTTTFVELVTASGKLRFEDRQLFWTADRASASRGDPLACTRLERSWGGGSRLDGTAYFRGRLVFACTGAPGAIEGDVSVDCGGITPDERRGLDANRQQMLDEQRAGAQTSP